MLHQSWKPDHFITLEKNACARCELQYMFYYIYDEIPNENAALACEQLLAMLLEKIHTAGTHIIWAYALHM